MSHKLSFLVGGVQKCGTTSLHAYLCQHPQLLMSSKKETHFFDDESKNWEQPDYEQLNKFFDPSGDERIRGESTPITIYWKPAHMRILQYNPDMKFIFLFRDPVLRAYSHWCMEIERGWDNLNFATAIRDGRERITENVACEASPKQNYKERGEVPGHSRVYSYVERGFYGRQTTEILRYFPISNMLFLRSEELKKSPDRILTEICEFLRIANLTTSLKPIFLNIRRCTASLEQISDDDLEYLRSLYLDDLKLFANLTGLNISDWPTTQ